MNCAQTYKSRRQKLTQLLPGKIILLSNGLPHKKNLPSLHYPFRGNSHFLYFCGKMKPGTIALISSEQERVFVEEQDKAHKIWEGSGEDPKVLAQKYGFDDVLNKNLLPSFLAKLGGHEIRSLPTLDFEGGLEIQKLLNRNIDLNSRDRELALAVINLRLFHDALALSEIRLATDATVQAHLQAMRFARVGCREWEVADEMEKYGKRVGLSQSFPSIVTVHGEILHNTFQNNILTDNDLLLVDFGLESELGFAGDLTRTWPVRAKFSAAMKELYELVLTVQKEAISKVKPGVRFLDLHLGACKKMAEGLIDLGLLQGSVEELVEKGTHALFFPHGLGHLVGLDVHDMEDLGDLAGYAPGRKRSAQFGLSFLRLDRDLAPNMVVTIEPGFYIIPALLESQEFVPHSKPSWEVLEKFKGIHGIRIEDMVLVTDQGHEILSKDLPKEIQDLEKIIGQ